MSRLAVVLFNLGGPDGPDAVRPFLFNLFRDPAIIGAPAFVRYPLAALISTTRTRAATANYALMGGGSPLLPETRNQAEALEAELARLRPGQESKVFIAMRYWKPFAAATAAEVEAWRPDEIVLLPLYPQFSTTTTDSSLKAWKKAGGGPAKLICCYPDAPGFIEAHAEAVMETWQAGGSPERVRVLWSAHGLPEKIILDGDPYQKQVEETVAALRPLLPDTFEHAICYQSRVGPVKWIGPATETEIERAGADKTPVIVVPIAFVSEHIETLVELDEEYYEVAHEVGVPLYLRAPALGTRAKFIDELARLTTDLLEGSDSILAARTTGCVVACPSCPRAEFGGCAA